MRGVVDILAFLELDCCQAKDSDSPQAHFADAGAVDASGLAQPSLTSTLQSASFLKEHLFLSHYPPTSMAINPPTFTYQ